MLVVTHNREISQAADRVVELSGGRIVNDGPPEGGRRPAVEPALVKRAWRCIGLWLRWSWRDLRARWIQVAAIALIVALGVGVYTGLSSQNQWRRQSYDASYEVLAIHDLLVATTTGTRVDEGALLGGVAAMSHPEWVAAAEERLDVTTQVDASTAGSGTILVPGRIVGVDMASVTGHTSTGSSWWTGVGWMPMTIGADRVLLDSHFAEHHDLAPTGTLSVSLGERRVHRAPATPPSTSSSRPTPVRSWPKPASPSPSRRSRRPSGWLVPTARSTSWSCVGPLVSIRSRPWSRSRRR